MDSECIRTETCPNVSFNFFSAAGADDPRLRVLHLSRCGPRAAPSPREEERPSCRASIKKLHTKALFPSRGRPVVRCCSPEGKRGISQPAGELAFRPESAVVLSPLTSSLHSFPPEPTDPIEPISSEIRFPVSHILLLPI